MMYKAFKKYCLILLSAVFASLLILAGALMLAPERKAYAEDDVTAILPDNHTHTNACTSASMLDGKAYLLKNEVYYLSGNLEDKQILVEEGYEATLCLNGFNIEYTGQGSPINVDNGGTLTLCDCEGTGHIIGDVTVGKGGGVYVNGNFTMYGGTISDCNTPDAGGGVYVKGTFTMYGGEISGNTADYGGGVCIEDGSFTMYGGEINGNTASIGGGVYVANGSFTMENGEISGNTANHGGGVYVYGEFTMKNGTISGNEAEGDGGGVYVNGGTFTMCGGTISGNEAVENGGGVCIGSVSKLKVSGAVTIMENTNGEDANNVYFAHNLIEITDTLTGGAKIGVNNVGAAGAVAGYFTQEGNPADFFIPDDAAYDCIYVDDSKFNRVIIATHDFTAWAYDDTNHWHECANCGESQDDEEAHSFADGECTVCETEAELYWGLSSGVLTISSYKTEDTPNNYAESVWHNYQPTRDSIISVTVDRYAYAPQSMENWFWNCTILETADLSGLDTSRVTTMMQLFADCGSLSSANLSGLNNAQVTNMGSLFRGCTSLTSLYLTSFNTASLTDANMMFYQCSSLTTLNISDFDVSELSNASLMFGSCSNLTSLSLPSFENAEKFVYSGGMFSGCSSLTELDLSTFDTSNVTAMNSMFSGCSSLTSLDFIRVEGFTTANVENMSYMFSGCSGLTSLNFTQFENFNTANVTNMSFMFRNCSGLTSLILSGLDTSSVEDMSYMFSGCSGLTAIDLSGLNTSNVQYMSNMFRDCSSLTTVDLSGLDTSNVTNMSNMFRGCSALSVIYTPETIGTKALPLPDKTTLWWNETLENIITGSITSADAASKLSVHTHEWNTEWSHDETNHWHECICGETQDEAAHSFANGECTVCSKVADLYWKLDGGVLTLSSYNSDGSFSQYSAIAGNGVVYPAWYNDRTDITSVEVETYAYAPASMYQWFYGCANLEAANLSLLDTSRVTDMEYLFCDCISLTTINLNGFNTAGITSTRCMFYRCVNLTTIDLSMFDTSNVTDMRGIFEYCSSLTTITAPATMGDTALPLPDSTTLWWNEDRETIITGTITSADANSTIYIHEHDYADEWTAGDNTHWHECNNCDAINDEAAHSFANGECTVCNYDASELYWAIKTEGTAKNLILTYYQKDEDFQEYGGATWSSSRSTITSVTVETYAYAPASMYQWFSGCANLEAANLSNLDTSRVTSMRQLFVYCGSLTSLNLTGVDTSKVTDMYCMFFSCSSLTSLDVTGFNTSRVTDMNGMFSHCSGLTSLNLTGFDTSTVTDMSRMFQGSNALTALDLSSFDTSQVTDASEMFGTCSGLTTITAPATMGETALPLPDNTTKWLYTDGETVTVITGEITSTAAGKTLTKHAACTPAAAIIENEVEATCATAGSYDEVVYCSVCHSELSRTTVKTDDKIPHSYNENGVCTVCNSPANFEVTENGIKTYYQTITEAFNAASDNATVKMLADFEGDSTAVISGKNITLNLNGHNLTVSSNITLISVEADGGLILCDLSEEGNGSIGGGSCGVSVAGGSFIMESGTISGNTASGFSMGGGVYVEDGSFTMAGGTISGNEAMVGGGGVYIEDGSFTMTGGTISGNTAEDGGGVAVGDGVFTMSGGTISGNTAEIGGGVYFIGIKDNNDVSTESFFKMTGGAVSGNTAGLGGGVSAVGIFIMEDGEINDNTALFGAGGVLLLAGSFEMSGGEISGNAQTGDMGLGLCGGVCVGNDLMPVEEIETTLKISGAPVITGNKVTIDGNEVKNNVCLFNDNKITVSGTLEDGAVIGVNSTGAVVTGFTQSNPAAFFIPDDENNNCISVSGGTVTIGTHDYGYDSDGDGHWQVCANCGEEYGEKEAHDGNPCTVCGFETATADSVALVTVGTTTTQYATIEDAFTAANNAGTATVKMLADAEISQTLTVDGDKNITLNLNGRTLKMTGSGSVIEVNGTFTLEDNGGVITGGNARYGGGITVFFGTFIMNGGTISGNTADYGGGVFVDFGSFIMNGGMISGNTAQLDGGGVFVNSGTFEMTDGTISQNDVNKSGGGVFVGNGAFAMSGGTISGNEAEKGGGVAIGNCNEKKDEDGEEEAESLTGGVALYANDARAFTMTGGTISGNTAYYDGGGVFVNDRGVFTMEGGTITQNSAIWDGGGVYIGGSGTFAMEGGSITANAARFDGGGVRVIGAFSVSGAVTVTGNTDTADNSSNVCLHEGTITVTGELTDGAIIGINNTGAVATGFTQSNPAAFFIPDDETNNCISVSSGTVSIGTHDIVQHEAKQPTCTEKGWNAYETCSRCDYATDKVELPALGHEWNDGEITAQPNCTDDGEKVYTCAVCGETKTESISALGHTEVTDEGTDPTCTAAGKTDGKHCSVCNTVLVEQTEIAALGHDLTQHAAKAATCTEAGWNAYETCSRCDHNTYSEIAALGHDFATEFTIDKAATCTEEGSKSKHCSRCDETTEVTAIAVIPHKLTHNPETPATEDADGNIEYWSCDDCNKYFSDEAGTTEITDKSGIVLPKLPAPENNGGDETADGQTPKSGLSAGAIAGITVGVIVFVLIAAYVACYFLIYRSGILTGKLMDVIYVPMNAIFKKKKKEEEEENS